MLPYNLRTWSIHHIVENLFLAHHSSTAVFDAPLLQFQSIASRIIARPLTAVRDMESPVNPDYHVKDDNDYFHQKVENVEASLVVVCWRIIDRSRRFVVGAHAEGRSQREKESRRQKDGNLRSEPTSSEFLDSSCPGDDQATNDQRKWQETDDGVEGSPIQNDGTIDVFGMAVQRIEILHVCDDEHDERDDDEHVDCREGAGEEWMPSTVRVCRSYDSLREDEVDDEEKDHASGHKNLCSNGNSNVSWSCCPDYAHDTGGDAGHAEAERHARHEELMPSLVVQLEYRHVGNCAADEEEQEYSGDWDIGVNGRDTAQAGGLGRIRGMLDLLRSSSPRRTSLLLRSAYVRAVMCTQEEYKSQTVKEGVGCGLTCLGSRKSIGE